MILGLVDGIPKNGERLIVSATEEALRCAHTDRMFFAVGSANGRTSQRERDREFAVAPESFGVFIRHDAPAA